MAMKTRTSKQKSPLPDKALRQHPPTQKKDQLNKADEPKSPRGTKQEKVLALLRRTEGATIATIMKATGWQQHSVRGFLAGVVRKRLKLTLTSKKVDGNRVYRIPEGGRQSKAHQAA